MLKSYNIMYTLLLFFGVHQCKMLEQHMDSDQLEKEYNKIPKRPGGECTVAQLPESADKNRFQDVLPYDSNRVELVPTKENNTGYINASHVRVSFFDSQIYSFFDFQYCCN